jgi:hypothetical protein
MANDQGNKPALSKIDPEKRQFIAKLIGRTAFVAPLVVSFAMDSINTSAVASTTSNVTRV